VIRVAVVDDQELVRAGFQLMLEGEPDLEVVGQAGAGLDAIDVVRRLRPDVTLMDIRMPGPVDGVEATRRLLAHDPPPTRVIILTTFDADDYVYDALDAGASGFLLKNCPPERLLDAVRTVATGDGLLEPAITMRVIREFSRRRAAVRPDSRLDSLTRREADVLREVAAGLSNGEIAARLYLSEATVKSHLTRILLKLEARDRVQAVVRAYETGFVTPGGEPTTGRPDARGA
jgi:DNA-binding NarL/FixJ family response regulator